MKPTPESLSTRHLFLFGHDPDEVALTLYRQFPERCGYSGDFMGEERDPAKLNAVITLALNYALTDAHVRVVFFVPKSFEVWVTERLRAVAQSLFATLKAKKETIPPEKLRDVITLYKRIFEQLMIGSSLTHKAPTYWVAYGYRDHDPAVPGWLRQGLL